MTHSLAKGVGGATQSQALSTLSDMTASVMPIGLSEFKQRISKAQAYMQKHGIDALYVNAGTNLYYFTGLRWYASERLVGAIIPAFGEITYIVPTFEIGSIRDYLVLEADIASWQEHENPYALVVDVLKSSNVKLSGTLAMDESAAFFIFAGLRDVAPTMQIIDAKPVTAHCRMHKSASEIALIQQAMDMTLEVHKAAASILCEGILSSEVEAFIHQAHKAVGAAGSSFCIVLFGRATSFPHGVKAPQRLAYGDTVLIDTGCRLEGYNSDITRTYVFGQPTQEQCDYWQHEKAAQQAAFDAARLGEPCGVVDDAARKYLASVGLGPDYDLPGCPHRTGHGIGLDIHEWPYLVRGNATPLAEGMCFSNEPMLVVPDKFGIRLEDHFYMTPSGAKWFTEPSKSIHDPFGNTQ